MTGITQPTKFIPQHLHDIPSDEDKFGGHRKIAIAIKEIIDNPPKEEVVYHRKPIGLLGGWGSGKSSVIKNLCKLYNDPKNKDGFETFIFEFDAWVYENDPIRRSFLEAFIKYLTNPEGGKKTTLEEWSDDLDKIKGQKERHKVKSTPTLTTEGRYFSASLLAFTIGTTLTLHRFFLDSEKLAFSITAILLLFSPFLTAGIAWIGNQCSKDEKRKKRDLFHVFVNEKTDEVTNEIIKTPDPTAIEFQDIFSRVLTKCLTKKDRLIIVIDNLDRLPEEKAHALWATMRSFFVDRDGKSETYKNLWLIVPLDPVSLRDLFSKDESNEELVKAKIASYLEKTFEITFRVAPPVLSDWEDLLIEKGQEAFFDESIATTNQWKTIARLYEVYLQEENVEYAKEIVTPRKIISLINSISSLYRLWQFPIEIIALYSIFKRRIERNVYDITKEDYLPTQAINIVGEPNWRDYISALYFNTDPSKAIQILISDRLISALKEGEIDKAGELISTPGGASVAETLVQKYAPIWSRTEPDRLFNAAYTLSGLREKDIKIRQNFWRYLSDEVVNIENWNAFNKNTSSGAITLLYNTSNIRTLKVAENLVNSLQHISDEKILEDNQNAKFWFDTFSAAAGYITNSNIIARLDLPANIAFRCNILLLSNERTPKSAIERFVAAPDENQKGFEQQISNEIGKRISAENFDERYVNLTDNLLQTVPDWDFSHIVAAIDKTLRNRKNTIQSMEILNRLFLYSSDVQKKNMRNMYTTLCTQGIIFDHMHLANEKEDLIAFALCAAISLKFNPTGNIQNHHKESANGQALFNEFLSDPQKRDDLTTEIALHICPLFNMKELVEWHHQYQQLKPTLTIILNKILELKGKDVEVSPAELITNYNSYHSAFGEQGIKKLILSIAQNDSFFQTLQHSEFTGAPLGLHITIAEDKSDIGKQYHSYAVQQLNNMTSEKWQASIANQDEKLRIALALQNTGTSLDFGAAFRNALENFIEDIYVGRIEPPKEQNWDPVVACLSEANQKIFYKNVRDKFIDKGLSENTYKIFKLLSVATLIDEGEFKEKGKADGAMRHLFIPMLSTDNGVAFLRNNSEKTSPIFKNSSKEAQKAFIQDLHTNIHNNFNANREKAKTYVEIAKAMDLTKTASLYEELEKQEIEEAQKAQNE